MRHIFSVVFVINFTWRKEYYFCFSKPGSSHPTLRPTALLRKLLCYLPACYNSWKVNVFFSCVPLQVMSVYVLSAASELLALHFFVFTWYNFCKDKPKALRYVEWWFHVVLLRICNLEETPEISFFTERCSLVRVCLWEIRHFCFDSDFAIVLGWCNLVLQYIYQQISKSILQR